MSEIKTGVSQFNRPAPALYRRFTNAMIIFIIPATAALIMGWGLSEKLANRWLLILTFVPALIKGIGVVIGNGEYIKTYAPDKDALKDDANSL
jgi:hypothetical protein